MKTTSILFIAVLIIMIPVTTVLADNTPITFPLVVYGGEPEGVMAAVAAARNGTRTLLIMERTNPGGLMTYGGLNYLDINYGPEGNNLNKGLFAEWHSKIGGGISFSIKRATRVFNNMLATENNLTVYRNSHLKDVNINQQLVKSIFIRHNNQLKQIKTTCIIDASQNADLAIMAGVPHFNGGGDIGLPDRTMAVTLVLHIGNIDWEGLKHDSITDKFGPSHINKDHAWGFVKIGELYQPTHPDIRLRGLNIVLEENIGQKSTLNAYINAMLIFNTDPNNPESLNHAYQIGKNEAEHILAFFRKNLGGFEESVLLEFPRELYVRESRHIVAMHQLNPDDLLHNRIFSDTIALASYPLDYQASNPDYNGFVLFNPDIYGIPFRSLVPVNIDNMLVVGRSSGYSSLAAASARVLPTGMTTGEAAGIAANISLTANCNFKAMINNERLITELQDKLEISMEKYNYIQPIIQDQLVFPYLSKLVSWGLVIAGYNNNFHLNNQLSEREFAHLIVKGLKRRKAPILYEWVPGGLETLSNHNPLTRDRAAMLLLAATSHRVLEMKKEKYYSLAISEGLIPEIIEEIIPVNRILTRRETYIILASFLDKYSLKDNLRLYRGGE